VGAVAERLFLGIAAAAESGPSARSLACNVKIGGDRERPVLEHADDVDVRSALGLAAVMAFVGDGAGWAAPGDRDQLLDGAVVGVDPGPGGIGLENVRQTQHAVARVDALAAVKPNGDLFSCILVSHGRLRLWLSVLMKQPFGRRGSFHRVGGRKIRNPKFEIRNGWGGAEIPNSSFLIPHSKFSLYISSITSANRSVAMFRLTLKVGVRRPFSIENSASSRKLLMVSNGASFAFFSSTTDSIRSLIS